MALTTAETEDNQQKAAAGVAKTAVVAGAKAERLRLWWRLRMKHGGSGGGGSIDGWGRQQSAKSRCGSGANGGYDGGGSRGSSGRCGSGHSQGCSSSGGGGSDEAAAVAEAVAVAAAETAATAVMAMAIAGGGQDKREVGMWFHVYQIYWVWLLHGNGFI